MTRARCLCLMLVLVPASLRAQSFCSAVTADTLVNPIVLGNGTPGSVTTAQIQAALNAGGHIRFNVGTSPTTIAVSATLVIDKPVVLDGGGIVTLSGGGARRILQITNPSNVVYGVTLQNIVFANGSAPTGSGGAILKAHGSEWWQYVSLKLVNCYFRDNVATSGGQDDGGGAVYVVGLNEVRIGGCTFTNNRGSNGGAFYSLGSKQVTIADSTFTGNAATGTGGNPGNGGNAGAVGIDGQARLVDICRTRFVGNTSNAYGSGFFSVMYDFDLGGSSRSRFEDVTFDGNRQLSASQFAAGVYVQGGPFAFERVSFVRNEANGYTGLFLGPDATGTIRNGTFVGNVARQGLGGAMAVNTSRPVSIVNTTIANNYAGAFAAGISVDSSNQLRLTNVILANNTGGNAWVAWNIQNPAAQDGGGNMQWPASRPNGGAETKATPSTVFANPLLAPADANNGGQVPTIALGSASPARDTGVATGEVPATDARGAARLGAPDRGSYEIQPVTIGIADTAATEGAAAASFTVSLSRSSFETITVHFATANGTATAGSDYTATSGTLSFPPYATSRTLTVAILGDLVDEPDETLTVTLSSPSNATLADATGQGTILDDDPTPQIVVEDCAAVEGDAGTTPCPFRLSLSGPKSSTVSVGYATANGTALAGTDYDSASGTVSFAPLSTGPQTVNVSVRGDTNVELDETFLVNLSGASGATLPDAQGVGTLLDDDAPSLSSAELSHGSRQRADLRAQPATDQDFYRIAQRPYSSYEIVVDASSGDFDPALVVARLAADNATVLQTAAVVGVGSSTSLRWQNALPETVVSQHIRVTSDGCTGACGADDVYEIRAYDTTYTCARFNSSGTQASVLLLQNPTNATVSANAYFWQASGRLLHIQGFTLAPHSLAVLGTASVPALVGTSGSVTVTSDAAYGALKGKIVALEAATGFSFDSTLEPRPKP